MPNLRLMTLCGSLVVLLLSVALMGSCQPAATVGGAAGVSEAEQAANDLAQDVGLLYTLNRLDLQPTQLDPLYAVAQQAQQARLKAEPSRQAALAQLVPLLREKRTLLLTDQDVPAELDKQLRTAQAKVEYVEEQVAGAALAVVPALRKVLTDDQIAIITGADEAHAQAHDLLDWIRQLSPGTYAEEGKANAEQLADPEVKLTTADILKMFDETRKLSDADFAAKEGQYVARLAPLYSPTLEASDQALADLLASPRLPLLLQERGAK
jgi:hypothetical protein